MIEVQQTDEFTAWYEGLRDQRAVDAILQRITRLRNGLVGDAKFFDGIGELRVNYGPGYRVYFIKRGTMLVLLLCGGNKSSQGRDIAKARRIAKEL